MRTTDTFMAMASATLIRRGGRLNRPSTLAMMLIVLAIILSAAAGCSKAVKIDAAEYTHSATRQAPTPVTHTEVRIVPPTTTTVTTITLPERLQ